MKKDTGGPAFPVDEFDCEVGEIRTAGGMTLRDYFAAKAMNGIVSVLYQGIRPQDISNMAADCYGIADAMLKERDK